MRNWIRLGVALCFSLIAQLDATAQVERGILETSFSASLSWTETSLSEYGTSTNDTSAGGLSLRSRIGYFVSKRFDVGGVVGFDYSEIDEGSSYRVSLGPAANYHFRPQARTVPFIGGAFGALYHTLDLESAGYGAKTTADGWFAEARGGADFFLSRAVAIKLQCVYRRRREDSETTYSSPAPSVPVSTMTQVDSRGLGIWVGIAVFLNRPKDL